jgi:gas vesicle protein
MAKVIPKEGDAMNVSQSRLLEDGSVFWGIVLGVLIGAIWALFNLPSQLQEVREQVLEQGKVLRDQITTDTVTESLEQGKSMARR